MYTVDSILLSIVFFDISMPLLESMLLSVLLTPVEIGPSNASPVGRASARYAEGPGFIS